jgi:adenylate cyclase
LSVALDDADPLRQPGVSSDDSRLLEGLDSEARRDRAELIPWLLERGFTANEIAASDTPMLLLANRVMGYDGVHVSANEMSRETGIDRDLLLALQRAAGLPRIDDPDAAVLPRADVVAAARAKYLIDLGVSVDDAVAIVRVLTEGLGRAVAMLREPTFKVFVTPGASEVELAEAAEGLAQASSPLFRDMVVEMVMLQLRHMFEGEGITAAERAAGRLPTARQVAVAFADLAGFTRLGETVPPDDLERVATRLAELAHDVAEPPVLFIKSIGDAVMFVSPDCGQLIRSAIELIAVAEDSGLPPLRAGVAAGLAVSRAGDWFGSPVNIASRVIALARARTVVVTESAREMLDGADEFAWSPVGEQVLRGVTGAISLFGVDRLDR